MSKRTERSTVRSTVDDTQCSICGDYLSAGRWALGYKVCLTCGEEQAKRERAAWCVVPMHKSNYFFCTDKADLKGINNKGGLVK